MKNWIKLLIEILIVVFLFALISELILRSTIGYETEARGRFSDGLFIEGEIEYYVDYLEVGGEEWEASFYNLSSVYIKFYNSTNVLYEETISTSKMKIIPIASGDGLPSIRLKNISDISRFAFANFSKGFLNIELGCSPDNQIIGRMKNTTSDDDLGFHDILFITDSEIINSSQSRGKFYFSGENEEIKYNISTSKNYHITTYPQIGDIIQLKGDLKGYNFQGSIWSNGKLITHGNPKLSGEMELKILQNPETYYNHESHDYDWELDIEGEYEVEGGGGYPFWSFGLMLSTIPSIIIILYHIHKKVINEREGLR